jgi:transposase
LTAEGLPAICIDARHAKAALDMAANKTDANDADGLAHLAEVGFCREVRVKGFDSMLISTLISGRRQLMKMRVQMSNQIRGLQKTFGLVVPKGTGSVFERNVVSLLDGEEGLARIIFPLLKAWSDIRLRVAELTKQLVVMAGADQRCRLLTSVPGVGTVTACPATIRVRIASPEMLPSVVVLPHLKCSRRWLGGEDEESQHGDAERIG